VTGSSFRCSNQQWARESQGAYFVTTTSLLSASLVHSGLW